KYSYSFAALCETLCALCELIALRSLRVTIPTCSTRRIEAMKEITTNVAMQILCALCMKPFQLEAR
ncbi:MAG TPA: hypothetical protein PLP14_06050, partial [Chitinophagaceae bacterium]|nr:hypothetical protein [Chitinophagaceae bacterium]